MRQILGFCAHYISVYNMLPENCCIYIYICCHHIWMVAFNGEFIEFRRHATAQKAFHLYSIYIYIWTLTNTKFTLYAPVTYHTFLF